MTMSQANASSQPPPSAYVSTAAMTGFGNAASIDQKLSLDSPVTSGRARISSNAVMSALTQNMPWAPAMTTANTAVSDRNAASSAPIAPNSSSLRLFFDFGRLISSRATAPSRVDRKICLFT